MEDEHLLNLVTVLEHLQQQGKLIERNKCKFMCTSVEYLRHRIDSEGLHAISDKLQAFMGTTAPNVHQLH